MLDKAITDFLESKKQDFLEKKVIAKTSEENKLKLFEEANEKYLFKNWLFSMKETADAFFTTHPSKLTHSTPRATAYKQSRKQHFSSVVIIPCSLSSFFSHTQRRRLSFK